jgi:hypothetical protein
VAAATASTALWASVEAVDRVRRLWARAAAVAGGGASGGGGGSTGSGGGSSAFGSSTTGTSVAADATGVPSITITYTVPAGGGGGGGSAPNTVINFHPGKKVKTKKKRAKVKFGFSSSVAGASFLCKLDKGEYARCTSPKRYRVKPGKHTFSVEAVSAGVTDPTAATFSFKVKKKH